MWFKLHLIFHFGRLTDLYPLKIKQAPLSLKLEPQIWVLEWFLITKPKAFDIPEQEAQ